MFRLLAVSITVAVLLSLAAGFPAEAQLGKLKKKVKDKVEKKADEKTDEKIDGAIDAVTGDGKSGGAGPAVDSAGSPESGDSGAGDAAAAGGNDWALYKKYDFVPGNTVIFYDDLTHEETGEFPSRWNLVKGVFEIAQLGPDKWIACTDEGRVTPRIRDGSIPDHYTVEIEFYDHGKDSPGHWLHFEWLDADGEKIGSFMFADHKSTVLEINGKRLATKDLTHPVTKGVHAMRIMATRTTIKCYIDGERMANVPRVDGFQPAGFGVFADLWNRELDTYPLMFRNFRFAEGGKTMKEQMAEAGRIVTHGILFDSGSTNLRPESHKTLADIGDLLSTDAALRVAIEGHTDSDGNDAANQTLSEGRAAAVKTYLCANFKIAPDRLETRGYGESKPMAANDTPEGKANNRRVEFVRL